MIGLFRALGLGIALTAAGAFAIAMWEAALARADGQTNDIRANELHHAYLGLLLILAAVPLGGWRGIACLWLGAGLMVDDAYEHLRQIVEPAFQSPIHRLFARYLWPLAPVQWVVGKLNRLFGKRTP